MWLFWTCLFLQLQHIGRTFGKGGGVVGGGGPSPEKSWVLYTGSFSRKIQLFFDWMITWHFMAHLDQTDKKNQVLLLFYFLSLRAKRAPSLNNSIDGIFKLMLLYYEECGIFKGFGCPTYEEEYDRCTNFQFPRQSAKLSNVSNKKDVLVLAAVFNSDAMEY